MQTKVIYEIPVLHGQADGESKLTIEVNREEDIFQIKLDDKEICFGDWSNNLLEAIRGIVHTESTIET